jgi:hypothetical protein
MGRIGGVLRDTAGGPDNGVNEGSAEARGIRTVEALRLFANDARRSHALDRKVSLRKFDTPPAVGLAEAHRMSLKRSNLRWIEALRALTSGPHRSGCDEGVYLGEVATDCAERRANVMWMALEKSLQQSEDWADAGTVVMGINPDRYAASGI